MNTKSTALRIGLYSAQNKVSVKDDNEQKLATCSIHEAAVRILSHEDLVRCLGKIMRAHDSGNNGAYMGEAKLCQAFSSEARAALIAAGAASELMTSMRDGQSVSC